MTLMFKNEKQTEAVVTPDPVQPDDTTTGGISFEDLTSSAKLEPVKVPVEAGKDIEVRFVEAGFTAFSKSWAKGETVKVEIGSPEYQNTIDINGVSWLDLAGDTEAQTERWGRQMFEEI